MASRTNGTHSRRRASRHTDRLVISAGALGPVPACELEIRPLTVFIGAQGTGKSLVAQTLYAFEELPYLMAQVATERGARQRSSLELFRSVLDRLRSSDRRFGTFAHPKVSIAWQRSGDDEWPRNAPPQLEFKAYSATGQVAVKAPMLQFLDRLRRSQAPLHHAVFMPTERMVISQLRSAMSAGLLALPISFHLFTHWMDGLAAPAVANWRGGRADTHEGRLVESLGTDALGGRARKYGDQWKWQFAAERSQRQFDLDMASSGQRANWSIPYLARTLFSLRGSGNIAETLTVYVEEPEIHLHPAAQRKMVEILALLVHHGIRVVVTTHSLVVLYTLNNLLQASLLGDARDERLPQPELRLPAADVAVYGFDAGKPPRSLIDADRSFVDESVLARVDESLSAQLNTIAAKLDER